MIYSVVHFCIVQHNKTWDDRSSYEKFITVFGMVSISLIFFGVMFGEQKIYLLITPVERVDYRVNK